MLHPILFLFWSGSNEQVTATKYAKRQYAKAKEATVHKKSLNKGLSALHHCVSKCVAHAIAN